MISSAEEFVRLRLSESREMYARAATEDAPEQVWRDVLRDFPEMRIWVARNKTVPLSVLRLLAEDRDSSVRFAVAEKRKLDRALFELLSRDPDPSVRQRIAFNAKTPMDVLRVLAADENELVAGPARKRLMVS